MFAIFDGASSPNPEPRTDDFKGKENRNPQEYRISIPGFKTYQVFSKDFKIYNLEQESELVRLT